MIGNIVKVGLQCRIDDFGDHDRIKRQIPAKPVSILRAVLEVGRKILDTEADCDVTNGPGLGVVEVR